MTGGAFKKFNRTALRLIRRFRRNTAGLLTTAGLKPGLRCLGYPFDAPNSSVVRHTVWNLFRCARRLAGRASARRVGLKARPRKRQGHVRGIVTKKTMGLRPRSHT